jgi:hypothetical protein
MDTRFWGPGAWQLLHTITFHSDATPTELHDFFTIIPYILPCKYCRASLTEYYEKEPIPSDRTDMQKWLYRVHNLVNGKLRGQGILTTQNPTFRDVAAMYKSPPTTTFPAWDFLYSIAYNHPLRVKNVPMPGAPMAATSDADKNRWNILSGADRFKYWCNFWKVLSKVLPSPWKAAWFSATVSTETPCELQTKRAAINWLWHIRCKFDTTTVDPYRQVCSRLFAHSSNCSKSKRSKTCRRK